MGETRRTWTPRPISAVYLKGDPAPIIIDLPMDALVYKLNEAAVFNGENGVEGEDYFVRLPLLTAEEALIRQSAIAALLPKVFDPDRAIEE